MCRCICRYIVGLMMYAVGLFWAPLVILGIALSLLKRGPLGCLGLFWRNRHEQHPEVARNPKFTHAFLRTKCGMRFHYVHAGPTDGPLMLCLHGFPECWYSFHSVLEHYCEQYNVVAVDMRGYGDSDKPSAIRDYHKDRLMIDVQQIITALGYKTATLVASGCGGFVSWEVPYYFPNLIDRMIIINAPDKKGHRDYICRYPCSLLSSWRFFFYQLPILPEIFFKVNDYRVMERMFNGPKYGIQNCERKLTDVELGIYKRNAGEDITYPLNYFRAMNPIYTGMGLRRKEQRIRIPVLIVWGMQDAFLDFKMVPYMEAGLRNLAGCMWSAGRNWSMSGDHKKHCDNVTVHYIDTSSHWVPLDQPEEMLAAMDNFLRRL